MHQLTHNIFSGAIFAICLVVHYWKRSSSSQISSSWARGSDFMKPGTPYSRQNNDNWTYVNELNCAFNI